MWLAGLAGVLWLASALRDERRTLAIMQACVVVLVVAGALGLAHWLAVLAGAG